MTDVRRENAKQVVARWDRIFRVLASEPRRQIVLSLLDTGPNETVPLPECAMNPDVPVDFDRLSTELRHRHLPLMESEGFVQWQTEPMTASRGLRFHEAAVVLDSLHRTARELPDSLVLGCRRLEEERQHQLDSA